MSFLRRNSKKKSITGYDTKTADLNMNDETSKCKKFIRLSPSSSSKKRHSKHKEAPLDCEVEPEHSGSGSNMAKKTDQRLTNGPSEHDKEIQELKQAFDMFDKNNDGKISSEELGCVLRTLGHNHSSREVEDMIKNVDTNENGFVEYDEFLTMMLRASREQNCSISNEEARKREAFAVFDMDGNGFIDKHELKYVMRRLGEKLSDDDLKAMFTEADLNGDGLIDYDEFSRLHIA